MTPEITLDTKFDIIGHDESWRNYLAAELNKLLEASRWQSQLIQNITVSVVSRVANFEEIQIQQ